MELGNNPIEDFVGLESQTGLPLLNRTEEEVYELGAVDKLLGAIGLTPYLQRVGPVTVGGEMGREARDYGWVLNIREQCVKAGIIFWFKSTGSLFRRDGIADRINLYKQTGTARGLGIDITGKKRLFRKFLFRSQNVLNVMGNNDP